MLKLDISLERKSEIDKENRRLLANIADILKNRAAQPGDPRIQFNMGTPPSKNKFNKIVSRA